MTHTRWPALLALATIAIATGPLSARDLYSDKEPAKLPAPNLPKAAEIQALTVKPDKVALKGLDDASQLIITAQVAGGRLVDLTHDVKYEVADEKTARVTSAGRVVPLLNGSTKVTA